MMLGAAVRALAVGPTLLIGSRRFVQCEQESPSAKKEGQKSSSKKDKFWDPSMDISYDEAIMNPGRPWKREWVSDWDGRHPAAGSGTKCQGKIRHILLIRHGQYDLEDKEHGLTSLGFQQSVLTGKRLAAQSSGVKKDAYGELKIKYSKLVSSTVLRARQTAEIIAQELPSVPRENDDALLAEGWPVLPMPHGPSFMKDGKVLPATLHEEGPRIEAAFRKYFHRDVDHKRLAHKEKDKIQLSDGYAPAESTSAVISPEAAAAAKKEHEYIILVCHMNVIRYFVARALQLPPEVWLRMRGNNCGITEIIIQPNGQSSLGSFADVGHLSIEQVTFH